LPYQTAAEILDLLLGVLTSETSKYARSVRAKGILGVELNMSPTARCQ